MPKPTSPPPPTQEIVPRTHQAIELAKGPQTNTEALTLFAELAKQNVDVDKLERLMGLYERMIDKQGIEQFAIAMQAAQSEMRAISTDATNPSTHSRYATYAKLDGALRPIYTSQGFAVSYDTAKSDKPQHLLVLAYVSHRAGHVRTYQVEMPNDGKGARGNDVMTTTHATGAAMTYGMRYLLKMIFNVAVGEDDTDGNLTTPRPSRANAPASGSTGAKRAPAKKRDDGAVQIVNVQAIPGTVAKGKKNAGQHYTLTYVTFSDGKTFGTFDTKIGELAAQTHVAGAFVHYTTKEKNGKFSLESLEVVKEIDEAIGFGAELLIDREPGDELDEDINDINQATR